MSNTRRRISMTFITMIAIFVVNTLSTTSCKSRKAKSRIKSTEKRDLDFGGACELKGPWVTAAIESANEIRNAITGLKSALEKCNQLPAEFEQNLQNISQNLPAENAVGGKSFTGLTRLPSTLLAARKYRQMTGDEKTQARQYFDTLMDGKALEASLAATPAGVAAGGAAALHQRFKLMTKNSMQSLQHVLNGLATSAKCAVSGGGGPALRKVLIHSTRTLGAALTGDQSDGDTAAKIVKSMLSIYQELPLNEGMAALDRAEFMLSLSCLIESTSTSYCSFRDAQELLNSYSGNLQGQGMASAKPNESSPQPPLDETRILNGDEIEGYYILSQVMPSVNRWLMDIQVGVEPILKSDGNYQQSIAGIQSQVIQSRMALLSEFNDSAITIRGLTDPNSVANSLVKLVERLSNGLTNANFNGADVNFYTMSMPDYYIPYYLIGMRLDQLTDELKPSAGMGRFVEFKSWASTSKSSANGDEIGDESENEDGEKGYRPFFLRRDDALDTIQKRLRTIIDMGSSEASAYAQSRLKLDPANVIANMVISPNNSSNILQGLRRIHRYLTRLSLRVLLLNSSENQQDKEAAENAGLLVDSINETAERIEAVLSDLAAFSAQGNKNNQEFHKKNIDRLRKQQVSEDVIRKVIAGNADPNEQLEQVPDDRLQSRRNSLVLRLKAKILALKKLGIPIPQGITLDAPNGILKEMLAVGFRNVNFKSSERTELTDNNSRDRYLGLINKIYSMFEVLILRESYLSERLSRFVAWDMSETIRRSPQFLDSRTKEFIQMGDREILSNFMRGMGNGQNPQAMKSQMDMAYHLHTENFDALSRVFSRYLAGFISELHWRITNPNERNTKFTETMIEKSMQDSWYYWRYSDAAIASVEKSVKSLTDWIGTAGQRYATVNGLEQDQFNADDAFSKEALARDFTKAQTLFLDKSRRIKPNGLSTANDQQMAQLDDQMGVPAAIADFSKTRNNEKITEWATPTTTLGSYLSETVKVDLGIIRRSLNPELYPMPTYWSVIKAVLTGNGAVLRDDTTRNYGDDKFGSLERLLARLCIQSLAMSDQSLGSESTPQRTTNSGSAEIVKNVDQICKGYVLRSYWSDGKSNPGLNVYYDEIRNAKDPKWEFNPANGRQYGPTELPGSDKWMVMSRCALYDSSRRNAIHWMNLDSVPDQQLPQAFVGEKRP